MEKINNYDVIFVGYAVNSASGGYTNRHVKYIDTVGIKYLYNDFYETYCAEPVAFLQIAAELRNAGFSTYILDGLLMGYELDEMKEKLKGIRGKMYCFSMYESSEKDVYELMKFVKDNNNKSIISTGGPYVTLCYEKIMNKYSVIDYATIGDGDFVYVSLLNKLYKNEKIYDIPNLVRRDEEGKCIIDVPPEAIDLDSVHMIERDFSEEIMKRNFSFSMVGSRGCGHAACTFCYLPRYQKIGCQPKIRYRNSERLVEEVKSLVERFRIKKLTFVDEDFFGTNDEGVEHAISFLKKLLEENINIKIYVNVRVASVLYLIENNLMEIISKAGIRYMFIGFESYNDEILKKYNKRITVKDIDLVCDKLEEYNIKINPGLITFDPDINIEQVRRNVYLLKRIKYYDAFMFTRTLMSLPTRHKKENNNITNTFFKNDNTYMLYKNLVKFRDLIYELYKLVDYSKITENVRNQIINEHFSCFDEVYKIIENQYDEKKMNNTLNYYYQKIKQYIITIS